MDKKDKALRTIIATLQNGDNPPSDRMTWAVIEAQQALAAEQQDALDRARTCIRDLGDDKNLDAINELGRVILGLGYAVIALCERMDGIHTELEDLSDWTHAVTDGSPAIRITDASK